MTRRESYLHHFYAGFNQLFNINKTEFLQYYDITTSPRY